MNRTWVKLNLFVLPSGAAVGIALAAGWNLHPCAGAGIHQCSDQWLPAAILLFVRGLHHHLRCCCANHQHRCADQREGEYQGHHQEKHSGWGGWGGISELLWSRDDWVCHTAEKLQGQHPRPWAGVWGDVWSDSLVSVAMDTKQSLWWQSWCHSSSVCLWMVYTQHCAVFLDSNWPTRTSHIPDNGCVWDVTTQQTILCSGVSFLPCYSLVSFCHLFLS